MVTGDPSSLRLNEGHVTYTLGRATFHADSLPRQDALRSAMRETSKIASEARSKRALNKAECEYRYNLRG